MVSSDTTADFGGARSPLALLREPFVLFCLLGGGIFLLHRAVGAPEEIYAKESIVITADEVARLSEGFEKTRLRPPTRSELEGLIDEAIRAEVYVREALAMGLDRDDLIVRRRLRQKLEFLTEDAAAFVEPSDEELGRYLEAHPETFRAPGRLTLEQVFVKRERGRDAAIAHARELKQELVEGGIDAFELGDRTLLPGVFEDVTPQDLELQFGPDFTAEVLTFEAGAWHGPIESSYGIHLVRLSAVTPGEVPSLDGARAAVEREWRAERRRETQDAMFESLRSRYTVTVETFE